MAKFVAIIPAGGAGTRLWPLSRKSRPKFLLDMTGAGRTLIQATADRLAGADEILVVTGTDHAREVGNQLDLPLDNLIVEPSPRDSMPAIGLAAAIAEHRWGPETIVGSFAADHLIDDVEAFHRAVATARAAAEAGYLVTIGITPTGPDTGFGYIKPSSDLDGVDGAYHVAEFLEKPDREVATQYVADGYVWNAGMFVAQAGRLLDWLADYHPDLAEGLRDLAGQWGSRDCSVAWELLEKCVIDRAIAEPLAADGGVVVVPADMGWSDIGGYAALSEHLDDPIRTATGDVVPVVVEDSPGAVVFTGGRPIVVHGIENAVVVDTGDVLLVTTKGTEGLSGLVSRLESEGLGELR